MRLQHILVPVDFSGPFQHGELPSVDGTGSTKRYQCESEWAGKRQQTCPKLTDQTDRRVP